MRRLLRLTLATGQYHLPLCDATGLRLEAALLATEGSAGAPWVVLLAEDPALALWTVCEARQRENIRLDTTERAARWLSDLVCHRFPDSIDEAPSTKLPPDAICFYVKLAAMSVCTATVARELVGPHMEIEREKAYFAGLLQNACQWLHGIDTDLKAPSADLIDWLVPGEKGLDESAKTNHALMARVAQATELVQAALAADRGTSSSDWPTDITPRLVQKHYQQIVGHWQTCDTAIQRRLPALMAKLKMLSERGGALTARVQEEKLRALKELAYGASHEINNPLANISARAQTLLQEETDPERRRKLAAINAQAFRAHEMISDLMLFAHPPKLTLEKIDLTELLDHLREELSSDATSQDTVVERVASTGPVISHVDPVQLSVALKALCVNALEALRRGGHIRLELSHPPNSKLVELSVTDNGPGIHPEVQGHLFDPFYSGREAGRGLGFGLSKCWRIVREHGGQIAVQSRVGEGTRFTISLPVLP